MIALPMIAVIINIHALPMMYQLLLPLLDLLCDLSKNEYMRELNAVLVKILHRTSNERHLIAVTSNL
jgi:hypothetical protein